MALNYSDPNDIFFARTFHYRPTYELALVAAIVFGILTLISFGLTVMYGGRFMYIVPAMAFVEMLGYILLILTVQTPGLIVFIHSTLFLLFPPIALALVNYIVAGRLLVVSGKPVRVLRMDLHPKLIAKIFFWSDLVCFLIQAGGGGMLAISNPGAAKAGMGIVLFGLSIQLVFFCTFIYLLWRISTDDSFGLRQLPSLANVFRGLWITILLLLVRNVFRVVEFASAPEGAAYTTEWVFYVFETLPIALCILFFSVFHFGRLLQIKQENPKWMEEFDSINGGAYDEKSNTPV